MTTITSIAGITNLKPLLANKVLYMELTNSFFISITRKALFATMSTIHRATGSVSCEIIKSDNDSFGAIRLRLK